MTQGTHSYTSKHIALLLQSTSSLRALKQAHALLAKSGLLHRPSYLSRLIALSALSPWGSLDHARSLFNSAPPSALAHLLPYSYNAMIRAYSSTILPLESILVYNLMCLHSIPSNNLTYPFLLKACGRASASSDGSALLLSHKGLEVHCRVFHLGLDLDGFIQNSLVFMYSQCGRLDLARRVFDEMADRNPVSWNTMIAAYHRCQDFESADRLLGVMPTKTISSWNSMITMHVRRGDVESARRIFEEMPEKDAISWNSLISGYVHANNYKRALELFQEMQANKIEPTKLTLVSVLGACAEYGALEIGREIHWYLEDKKLEIEGFVGNALVDMYAKCGSLKLARRVFDEMGAKHVTGWNSMIVALAIHGHCEEALELFAAMEKEPSRSVKPNRVTFLGVLTACSHRGLVKEGREFFRRMVDEYRIEADIKHYGCMVDLLSRCGLLGEAYKTIKEMPIRANSVLWKTVLSASRVHGDFELAEKAFWELCELETPSDEDYVMMSNIYAEAEKWEDVERLRTGTIGSSLWKPAGYSQIELG